MAHVAGGIDLTTGTITLDASEREAVENVAASLVATVDNPISSREWTAAARAAWHEMPESVRKNVSEFRRYSGKSGALLIRNLPVDEDLVPATPSVTGSAQREPSISAGLLTMFASGLGDPMAYLAEKSGELVQDVVPVPGSERFQGNEGSVELSFHNENAFHPHRPDHVLLLCLRPDHERVAGLRIACVRTAFELLSRQTRAALSRAEFATQAPPSFNLASANSTPHAVLSGAGDDPDLVVDFAATTALTDRAGAALTELRTALTRTARTLHLVSGDMAVVDNRVSVHGRTEFTPRYDGRDRWLQRTFSLGDLRRSREYRPHDGHVLVK